MKHHAVKRPTSLARNSPVYAAAFTLVAASAVMNARYGASLGATGLDKVVWIIASIGSDVLKATSPLALVWAIHNRSASTAFAAITLLIVTTLYSGLAAIGFSASARNTMSAEVTQQHERYQRAKEAYQYAAKELAELGAPRPVLSLETRINTILANPLAITKKGPCGAIDGEFTRRWCPEVANLKAELARARRKLELEGQRDRARATMDEAPALVEADPQAAAIASYLQAITGWKIQQSAIQPWLVGVAALLVELGSVFGFLVANAGVSTRGRDEEIQPAETEMTDGDVCTKAKGTAKVDHEAPNSVAALLKITKDTGTPPVDGIEKGSCGRLRVSQRRLADALGRGRRAISEELSELAKRGFIGLEATKAGTLVTFTA